MAELIYFLGVVLFFTTIWAVSLLFTYQFAAFLEHGLNPEFWPPTLAQPCAWFSDLFSGQYQQISRALSQIATHNSDDFANRGWTWSTLVAGLPVLGVMLYLDRKKYPERYYQDTFGGARFATASEKAHLSRGLELGIDPDTGKPIRVQVEGTLLTVGPPRVGKTSGLLVPNLAFPELGAYAGPAVVIDPKGEVYEAVAERRALLGRRVIKIDPLGSNSDVWNPISCFDPDDILSMQRVARLILPKAERKEDDYFRGQAAMLISAAILCTFDGDKKSIIQAHRYITRQEEFKTALKKILAKRDEPIAHDALAFLHLDERTIGPIISTAQRGFEWLADKRMRDAVSESTFKMSEVAEGRADLFIVVPSDTQEILGSFTRWLLADLVSSIRRRPKDRRPRVLLFLDEAASLGRFEVIETAAAEFPGLGLSLWTFWQDRAQIQKIYTDKGCEMLIRSAEFVTVSDVSSADASDAKYWTDALGTYTGVIKSVQDAKAGSASATPRAVQLMTPDQLVNMPFSQMIVFPHSKRTTKRPIMLMKTVSYDDPRFDDFVKDIAPVKESE